jgi:hypothetical protein
MTLRSMGRILALLGLLATAAAGAAPASSVQTEVNFLLGFVEGSGCEFQRNGTWHSAVAAQVHLRDKYRYLAARDLIDTTEQFIERAATQSSFTGQPYQVRCKGGPTITSKQWLTDELSHMRAHP